MKKDHMGSLADYLLGMQKVQGSVSGIFETLGWKEGDVRDSSLIKTPRAAASLS